MAFYKRKPQEVEAHIFNGSSTAVGQFTKWVNSGVWEEKQIHTHDCGRILDVNGCQTSAGDYVVKIGDNFVVMDGVYFNEMYEPMNSEDREPGEYKAKDVKIGDDILLWGKAYTVTGIRPKGDDIEFSLSDGTQTAMRPSVVVEVVKVP